MTHWNFISSVVQRFIKNKFINTTLLTAAVTLLTVSVGVAASGAWNVDSDGAWNNNANWDGASFPNGPAETATFGAATSGPRVVTINGVTISISEVTFDNASGYTVAGAAGGSLTFAGGGNGQITVNNSNGNGAHTVSAPLTLNRNLTVSQNSTETLTLSGDISQDGSNRSLTKNGPGTLLLSGNNTFGGNTTVSQGTLAVGSDTALGSSALKPGSGTTIWAQGARVLGNKIKLGSNMVFNGDSLGFTTTAELPGNRLLVVENSTSFAKIKDPAYSRNLRKTGAGTLNLNFSGTNNPRAFIRHEGSSTGKFNMYGTGTVGRIIYYSGNGSRLAPGDTLDVSTLNVITGTGTLNVIGEIVLHSGTTLDVDLNGTTAGTDYDQLTYTSAASGGCDCVELNEAPLDVELGFGPTPGTTFSIINRAGGSGTVNGNFKDLPQGAVFLANGSQLLINYMPIGPSPTEVRLTRVDIPTDGVVAQSGTGQSSQVDTEFGQPLQVKVVDPNGDPIPNVRITFTAPASGASATFPNGNVGLTDASGVISVTVKANSVAGSYNVTANIGPNAVDSATFSLTNTESEQAPGSSTICLPIIIKNS